MKSVIILSSITYALKARDLLKNNGIYANITRSENVRAIRGCGYGLAFDNTMAEKAKSLLIQSGIPIIGSTTEK